MTRRGGGFLALLLVLSAVVGIGLGRLYLSRSRPITPAVYSGTAATRPTLPGEPVQRVYPGARGAPVTLGGKTLRGRNISLISLRGRVVVINVWASWCGPCRQEAPTLARISSRFAARGVSFLGVNVRDTSAAATAFADRYHIGYPSIQDEDARAASALRRYVPANAVPVSLVLDRRGRVAGKVIGITRGPSLVAALNDLLAESKPRT